MEPFPENSGLLYSISCTMWDESVFLHTHQMDRDSRGLNPSALSWPEHTPYCKADSPDTLL